MENERLSDSLLDRILVLLMPYDEIDPQQMKARLTVILEDYKICPKETALAIYTEGKNDYFLKKFLLAKAVAGRQKRTLEQYQAEISRTLLRIGKDADTITAEDVQVFLARMLTNGASKSYCDTIRRYLNSFYGWLYREELIRTNPMNRVDHVKFKREKENAFSDMEIELIRGACKTTMERAVVEMLLSTGCRASELVSIKITDLDGDKCVIQGKGGKYRTVYINAKAFVAIKAYLAERKDANPYLFPQKVPVRERVQKSGNCAVRGWYTVPDLIAPDKHFGSESVNSMVRSIGKRADVSGVHAHRFRRTCATQALRHGMPIELVSMMLGHEQISTTQIYLDVREDDLKAAHQKYVV